MYLWKYYTNAGVEVKGECGSRDELVQKLSRTYGWPGKNFRQYSEDDGGTWLDY